MEEKAKEDDGDVFIWYSFKPSSNQWQYVTKFQRICIWLNANGEREKTIHISSLFFLPWLVFSSPSLLGPRAPSSMLGLLISHGNRVGGNWQGKCTSWLAVPWTNWIGEKSCKLFISVQILSAAMILLGTLMKKERTGHVSQTHALAFAPYGCVIKFSTEKHRGRGYVTTHIGLITPILAHPSDDFKNYSPIMT